MEAFILSEVEQGVMTITLNRPDRLNSFNDLMHQQLAACLKQAERDDSVRCLLLTGAGRGFCAGQDLADVIDPVTGSAVPLSPADPGPHAHQGFDLDRPLREARDGFEKAYFEFHLAREGGSMTRVAEKTGLERTHLYRKLRQLGVELGRGKRN